MSEPILKEYGEAIIKTPRACQICHKRFETGTRMIRKKFRGNINYVNFLCLECEEKLVSGTMKVPERKFQIGELVRYKSNGTGNTELDGMVGRVIYIDSRDYTVEFPREIYDGITDYRAREIGIEPRFERGWFCREEHLEEECG